MHGARLVRRKAPHVARKQKIDYFEQFVKISEFAVEYADGLIEFLEDHFDEETQSGKVEPREALEKLQELHAIEEASDEVTHELVSHLVNEFVTPIEREDILALAEELDDVVDELDEVLQHIYMYCVTTVTPEVLEMAKVVHRATEAVHIACQKFTYFKKSHSIHDYIVSIHDYEDEGDLAYIRAVHEIFARAKQSDVATGIEAFGLAGVLASLERCCDACEAVGDSIVTVITKNS